MALPLKNTGRILNSVREKEINQIYKVTLEKKNVTIVYFYEIVI